MRLRIACAGVALFGAVSVASAQTTDARSYVPPAQIIFHWPEPAFLPKRQCGAQKKKTIDTPRLEMYAARAAEVLLWLPATREVALDQERHCITVITTSISGGRLSELALRGVSVPRRAVVLRNEGP